MPELVAGGPTIPVHLLNELDSRKVVFFCGAGISVSSGSGLPSFADLVKHVYEANHMEPDAVEREALDLAEENAGRRRPNLDKALGLLERPERLGAQALRRTVIERLSQPPAGALAVHDALINLSRNEHGVRLITTNFDNRFVEAGLERKLVDAAPKLPVPKPHSWASLVHLHGRIFPNEDGSNLVLTAADFGRAYLTEQWAARFVTELFREFTVVFVGYSVGDPVMSYMVDALAAERSKGARFATAYAFADEDGTLSDKRKVQDGWRAKNVEPILYDMQDGHVLLADTLIEWARIRNDPLHARSRIAINEMNRMPAGPDDPVVERVVWALQNSVAAKALADEAPIVDEEDFPKLERWLEAFAEKGLLSCASADGNSGAGDHGLVVESLVDNGFQKENPQSLDMTRAQLARWLTRHLHVPQLLAWVLHNGGHLHPGVRQQVERSLAAKDVGIPSRLRFLWSVLLDTKPTSPWLHLWTSDRYLAAASQSERRRIEDEAIESTAPRLIVRAGPSSKLAFRQYFEGKPVAIRPIDACGHVKLVSGEDDALGRIEEITKNPDVLSRHAETLTGYLEQALALAVDDDDVYPESNLCRPSIAEHDQNRDHDGWTHLIDLVRDSYFALAAANWSRGDNLLRRWVMSGQGLFERLALHALTENRKSDIRLAKQLLLAGRKPGVWELELRREVLRLFRLAGTRLPRTLRAEIVRAIHAGPRAKPRRTLPNYAEIIRREASLRLHKLSVSGVRLDQKSRALAEELEPGAEDGDEKRDEFLSWHGEARWVGDAEFVPKALHKGSVDDVVEALEDEGIDREGFRKLVVTQPVKAASALRRLVEREKWPSIYWQGYLWFLAEPRERPQGQARLLEHVARIIVGAPERLFDDIASAVAGFVKRIAERYGTDRETEFGALWTRAWSGRDESEPEVLGLDDPLTDALNCAAGKLAEAALVRLRKYEPIAGAGLPASVRAYFDAISCDRDRHLGRVMLATRLHYLFAIDPDWVGEHMIPRLDLRSSKEARDLWSAYGWSPTVGPDLLRAFKEPFLEILRDPEERSRKRSNLVHLFVTVCLEAPGELTADEIHGVVEAMSDSALQTVLGSLKGRLSGDPAERAEIWRQSVYPWLGEYWPRAAVRNTSGTSEAMLAMLAECGEAFPAAAEWSLNYLRPLEGHGLYRIGENGHAERHPDWMVRVLDQVVAAEILPVHQMDTVREILNVLAVANASMVADARFQRLHHIAMR